MTKHIFISYSKKDKEFTWKLADDLTASGHKVWIDRSLQVGEDWERTIEKNLEEAQEVIVVLSSNAIKSKWVQHEGSIGYGLRKPIFPILIEDLSAYELPLWAGKFQYHNFVGVDYEEAFKALNDVLTPPNPIQDLLEQQVQAYQQTGELLGDSLLGYIEENLDKVSFNETAKVLLVKSQKRRDRARREKKRNERLLKLGIVVLSLLTIAAIILSIFSFNQTQNLRISEAKAESAQVEAEDAQLVAEKRAEEADQARAEAEAQASLAIAGELAANASSLIDSDPELGILLAVESLSETYTVQAEETLRQLLVTSKLQTIVTPHQGQSVNSVEYSPDGELILTAGDDHAVRMWFASSGELYKELLGHTKPVTQASFSENGESIITISNDKTIRIWNTKSGEEERVLDGSPASISPDGKYIIGVNPSENLTQVWELDTYRLVQSINNTEEISEVNVGPEGKYAIITNSESIGGIWDVERGMQTGSLQGEILAFSPDGNKAITDVPVVWNLSNGENLFTLSSDVFLYDIGASFSDDGKLIVTWPIDIGNWNKLAQIWDANTGNLVKSLLGHGGDVLSANFDSSNKFLVTGSVDDTLRVWDVFTGETILVLRGHTADVMNVSFNPRDSKVVSSSRDGMVRTWELTAPNSRIVGDAIYASFGPNNTLVLNTGDSVVKVFSIKQDEILELNAYNNAFCRDGKWVAQKLDDSTIRILEASTGEIYNQVGPIESHLIENVGFQGPIISPNGKYLIVNNQVWETETNQKISELSAFTGTIPGLKGVTFFSADNELIALPDSDYSLHIWELATGDSLGQLIGHKSAITSIEFNLDATFIVSTSIDGSTRVWDTASGKSLAKFGDTQTVHMFAANFNPDGQSLLIGDWVGRVKIVEPRTGSLIRNFVGHNGVVVSAAFSPNGKFIITASGGFLTADHTARIWDANSSQLLYTSYSRYPGFDHVSFSEDGRWIISIDEGRARLMFCEVCVSYQELIQIAEERLAILHRDLTCREKQQYLHKDIECIDSAQNP